jgi:single-strand DNA-binding protein
MALNLMQCMGNLGQDPDIRYLPDSRAVVNISIACTDRYKDKQTGEVKENTEWIRAVAFGRRAEVIGEHFKKGSQIYISGKMRTREYEKDGVKHWATEIVIDNFEFCGQRSGGNDAKAQQQASAYGQQSAQRPAKPVQQTDNFDEDGFEDCPF